MFRNIFNYLKLFYYLLHPKAIFIRWTSHALGDNLLLSMLLPDLRRMKPDYKIIVETKHPELFINNPYPNWVTSTHFSTTKKFIKPKYTVNRETSCSIFSQMMSYIGIREDRSPKLYLSDVEIQIVKSDFPDPYLVIAPVGRTKFSANRKEWGFDKFQHLVELLNDTTILQVGMPSDLLLRGVCDARFIDVRKTAAIIANAVLFIGLEGGLMHLARSVDTPAVIIYGGYIKPEISGYPLNVNIATNEPCSPCYDSNQRQTDCEHMRCMKQISVGDVYNAVIQKLEEVHV